MTTHLPNSFAGPQMTGTLCGLFFHDPEHWPEGDQVITDWDEYQEVDCMSCLVRQLKAVPHPQPVRVRVRDLAKGAHMPSSKVLLILKDLHYEVSTPASSVYLQGFEHQALVAALATL